MNSSSNIISNVENVEGTFSTPVNYNQYSYQEFNHIQDDWTTLASNTQTNVTAVEQITTEVKMNDPKILLKKYHTLKEKVKHIEEFHKSLDRERDEIQKYSKEFDQTIFDSLRLFGRKNVEILSLTGKLSTIVKGEVEMETVRIQSLIDENKVQMEKAIEETSGYVKLLKECVNTLDEAERHNFENPYLCGICVERNITHVFRPCGHTICQTCMNMQHMWNCHICRKNIGEKIKVFFS
jgi:hypothetical protein